MRYKGLTPPGWVDRLEQLLRSSREQVARLPASSILDVSVGCLIANPEQAIDEALQFAEMEKDAKSAAAINAHLQSPIRDGHGRIDYRFEDLGLAEQALRERFARYAQ